MISPLESHSVHVLPPPLASENTALSSLSALLRCCCPFQCTVFCTLSFLITHLPCPTSLPFHASLPHSFLSLWPQQQQLQHLSHHAPGIPLTPHPSGLSLGSGGSGLLALTGALGVSAHLASKDERNHLDPEHLRGKLIYYWKSKTILWLLSAKAKKMST